MLKADVYQFRFNSRMTFHLADIIATSKGKGKRCRSHGTSIPERTATAKLSLCRLEDILQMRRCKLPQNLYDT